MTTLTPRGPYTEEELEKLYPRNLQLQLVQVLLRHGERSPVSARFRNHGLTPYWPYCNSARQLTGVIMSTQDWSRFDGLNYRRRIETFGPNDLPVIASGPDGQFDGVCMPGELTDKGRATTLALGQRLRHLYVDQLGFMPRLISDSDMIYLRATPLPRALESVQQTFWGMYPLSARTADFPSPTILTRTPAEETLYPNDGNCRRLAQLARAFAQRAADRWNDSDDMRYLSQKLGKYMPDPTKGIAVDSRPRLSGIMDTVNSTLAHGPTTRLPADFYDPKARNIIDRIGVEEWYAGYMESTEYRALGTGALVGDIVTRMVGNVQRDGRAGILEVGGADGDDGGRLLGRGRGGENKIKFALSGCHDTTLASLLSSFGAFDSEKWPPYSSHVALELFSKLDEMPAIGSINERNAATTVPLTGSGGAKESRSWWATLFGNGETGGDRKVPVIESSARTPTGELSHEQRESLKGYYVRIRYNDKVMKVPGCMADGKHLDGDNSFCTLEAFKAIADKFTPRDWKKACLSNLDEPAMPHKIETAGF
ncbi:histidine phosphatase superfamily [Lineolata rhizophorae]|uniref:3-phytase n=1 Tax=Lineolata rhizophorae TaxID=578093 RepID=A0A6A6PDK3_9PEZI|nr:histidine phosphatase superfamily [Lineolata rhizophorae]